MELEQGCGGRAMSAVPAPFVAAATEEEVGCLWSLGHGAHRLGRGSPTVLQGPTARMPGGSGGRECRKGPSLGRPVHFPRTGAQGRGPSIRGVSGGSLPLGCPGCGFIAGLTSLPSESCPAALPVRKTAFGQRIRPTDQAFQCQGWPGLDGSSGSPLP